MKRWMIYLGVGLAALVLLVVVIGWMLPKGHRATRMVRLKRRPEEVFAAIVGTQEWRGVEKEELGMVEGRKTWREKSKGGVMTFEEVGSLPPGMYQTRIADKGLPFGGTWTYEVTAVGEGCECRITEDGEVYNPVFRFVSRFVLGYGKTMEDYLGALGRKFGEGVEVEK